MNTLGKDIKKGARLLLSIHCGNLHGGKPCSSKEAIAQSGFGLHMATNGRMISAECAECRAVNRVENWLVGVVEEEKKTPRPERGTMTGPDAPGFYTADFYLNDPEGPGGSVTVEVLPDKQIKCPACGHIIGRLTT